MQRCRNREGDKHGGFPRRAVLTGIALWAVGGMPCVALADEGEGEGVSDWVSTAHARVRLIDAGGTASKRLAGLQVQLDPTFLTYWRTPGEAGVPPTARFDGSRNLASAALAFPAPRRYDEGGAEAFGYKADVIFPITVVPATAAEPVLLAVSLSFAVCSTLCLPAEARVQLLLNGKGDGPEAGLVRDALRLVPMPVPLGGAGALAVVSVISAAVPDQARVVVRSPAGTMPSLFVEAPDPWYIQVGPGAALGDGRVAFDLRIVSGAKTKTRVPVTLTLATDATAIETMAELDVAAPNP